MPIATTYPIQSYDISNRPSRRQEGPLENQHPGYFTPTSARDGPPSSHVRFFSLQPLAAHPPCSSARSIAFPYLPGGATRESHLPQPIASFRSHTLDEEGG